MAVRVVGLANKTSAFTPSLDESFREKPRHFSGRDLRGYLEKVLAKPVD